MKPLPQWLLAKDAHQFNRRCAVAGLLFLFATLGLKLIIRLEPQDFGQYYLAGSIARYGLWDALYPTPLPGSTRNVGDYTDSLLKPAAQDLVERRGMPTDLKRYMQPPPFALLLAPLGFLTYQHAYLLWYFLMLLCAWGICIQAGIIHAACAGRVTRTAGLIVLLMAVSPQAMRWVRVQNISPLIGLTIGWATIELLKSKTESSSIRAATALWLGAIAKYATLPLLPLYFAMRRTRALLLFLLLLLLILIISIATMHTAPFREFITVILPTLGRPVNYWTNQALEGFALRILHTDSLPPLWSRLLLIIRLVTLLLLLGLVLLRRKELWNHPANVAAAAAALVLWMLIFSPIYWEHYFSYAAPFVGWLIWEAARDRLRFVLTCAAVALLYVPLMAVQSIRPHLFEPVGSHMLWGTILMLIPAVIRLVYGASKPQSD